MLYRGSDRALFTLSSSAGNDPSATAVTAEVAWLVSVDATGNSLNMSAELSRSYREALDDFLLDATQRFRVRFCDSAKSAQPWAHPKAC